MSAGRVILRVVVGLVVAAVLVVVGIGLYQEFIQGDDGGEKADKAYERLDGSITRTFNRTDQVVDVPFTCLSRASNANPYGGPALAKCAPVCDRAAANLSRSSKRLEAVYRSSPPYLRRIYGRAFGATEQVLSAHGQYVDAMAEWARVHGASSSVGAAEFEIIRSEQARAHATDKTQVRSLKQARRQWVRYAERRWDLEYD